MEVSSKEFLAEGLQPTLNNKHAEEHAEAKVWCTTLLKARSYEKDRCQIPGYSSITQLMLRTPPFQVRRTLSAQVPHEAIGGFGWISLSVLCLVLQTGNKPIAKKGTSKYFLSLHILMCGTFCTLSKNEHFLWISLCLIHKVLNVCFQFLKMKWFLWLDRMQSTVFACTSPPTSSL